MGDSEERPVGLTKDVGWEIGARRTLPLSLEDAWELVISPDGVRSWLGEAPDLSLQKDNEFELADGTVCEIRVFKPFSHLRLRRRPPGTENVSTVQVRVLENGDRAVIAFHEEHLSSAEEREARRTHYKKSLDYFQAQLNN